MLATATELIKGGKVFADANDPNAGAWLPTDEWQTWLDSIYAVLYDRLLFSGMVTPFPTDVTVAYNPATGYMDLTPSPRAIIDVFRVVGSNYEVVPSAQHTQQYPNLDLMASSPVPGWGPLLDPSRRLRAWSAFVTPTDHVRVVVSPAKVADNYLIRTVADPDTSGGYQMPATGKEWVSIGLGLRAFAAEGVVSQAAESLFKKADDALQGALDDFQLKHDRKVSAGPRDRSGSALGPSGWWWRGF